MFGLIFSFLSKGVMTALPMAFDILKEHWRIIAVATMVGWIYVATQQINTLKIELATNEAEYTIEVDGLKGNISLQNKEIDLLHKKYMEMLSDYNVALSDISKLDDSLIEAIANISNEKIGEGCQAKINYLRDSGKDLKWED